MPGSATSPRRVGGDARVTGHQQYVADIHLPDELHAKLVTLPVARARIVAIDASAALAVPGVRLVMTAADLPQPVPRFGPQFKDRPVIATGETKYHGDPVAAVAADTKDAAEEGARLVRVEYEELPAVVTVAAALDPAAPLVQDPALRPGDPLAATNVLREHPVGWGDVDAAAAGADLVVDNRYTFPMVTHFAIEPHAFIAAPDGDGIAVWSSIQHPNWLQRTIASLVGMPLAKVRVFAPDPGGGFGGKQHTKYEPLVALMALRAGRPVRLVLTLEETFQAVRRTAAEVRVRTGVRTDGTLVFQDVEADYLIGAYADIADRVVGKGSYPACGPYRVPDARILARSILSHTVPSTAFRGFGNPQVNWAVESNLTEAAIRAGDRSPRDPAAQPGPEGRGVHPLRHPVRRRVGADRATGRGADRVGDPAAAASRPRHRDRDQVGADHRPLVLHGATACRWQRRRLRRHVGHGPGRPHRVRADRRRRSSAPRSTR